jgi:hypothetical protein
MRILPSIAVAACLVLPMAASAATVSVTFVKAEELTDTWDNARTPRATHREIEEHLKKMGERYLAPNDTLTIEILGLDLAGRRSAGGHTEPNTRIISGRSDWPRARFRYSIQKAGAAPSTPVEESISDMEYLRPFGPGYSTAMALPYEKRMFEEWFRGRFAR